MSMLAVFPKLITVENICVNIVDVFSSCMLIPCVRCLTANLLFVLRGIFSSTSKSQVISRWIKALKSEDKLQESVALSRF